MQIFVYMDILPDFSKSACQGLYFVKTETSKEGLFIWPSLEVYSGVYTDICIFVYMDILTDQGDLKPNQAVCFNCGNVLTSNDQYDMVICSCGAMAVDGGDYLRIVEFKENPARTSGLSPWADLEFRVKI